MTGERNCSLTLRLGPRFKPRTAFMVAVSAAMPHRSMFCSSVPAKHRDSSEIKGLCRGSAIAIWSSTIETVAAVRHDMSSHYEYQDTA